MKHLSIKLLLAVSFACLAPPVFSEQSLNEQQLKEDELQVEAQLIV
jgi:hypothetical protein